MLSTPIDKIADSILYEGYNLYPYRPCSIKNRHRWTFGVLYPRDYTEAKVGADDWRLQTQCLAIARPGATVEARVRFLHLVDCTVHEAAAPFAKTTEGNQTKVELRPVSSLQTPETVYHTWQKTVKRELVLRSLVRDGGNTGPLRFDCAGNSQRQLITNPDHTIAGAVESNQQSVRAEVTLSSTPVDKVAFRITLTVENHTPFQGAGNDREKALLGSLVSTHVILTIDSGAFVSLIDPPEQLRQAAEDCRNVGTWPVLAGEPGTPKSILSAPIILYDYPQVAPESPGNLFDGTEVDELLSLRIQTLTDEEQRQIQTVDEATRRLLDRTLALTNDEMTRLHGTFRDSHSREVDEKRSPPTVSVAGVPLGPGSAVRLHPRGRSDAFDTLLIGKAATIESIEQDFENRTFVTVTLDDDPGRDLGRLGQVGHRFFFRLDEIEPILDQEGSP